MSIEASRRRVDAQQTVTDRTLRELPQTTRQGCQGGLGASPSSRRSSAATVVCGLWGQLKGPVFEEDSCGNEDGRAAVLQGWQHRGSRTTPGMPCAGYPVILSSLWMSSSPRSCVSPANGRHLAHGNRRHIWEGRVGDTRGLLFVSRCRVFYYWVLDIFHLRLSSGYLLLEPFRPLALFGHRQDGQIYKQHMERKHRKPPALLTLSGSLPWRVEKFICFLWGCAKWSCSVSAAAF